MSEYKPEKVSITIEGIMLPIEEDSEFWEIIGNGDITTDKNGSRDRGDITNFRFKIPKRLIEW